MDFFQKIEAIKRQLISLGHDDTARDILDGQLSGGTGGEVLMIVCSKLLGIKVKNKKVYQLVKVDADALIDYARSIGLYPKPT